MDTKLLDVKEINHYWEHLQEAARVVRQGGLVAFPTETVYGLGANAQDPAAVERLYQVKRRPTQKEFARIIADLEEIKDLLEKARLFAGPLIKEFWPGPLTIVFSGYNGKDVGIRYPDHKVARDLVRLAGVPVLATSANISGMPPATDAQQALEVLNGKIEIVLDGGPCPLGIPSTVVKVSPDSFEIIRLGAVSEERIYNCLKQSALGG